MHCCLPNYFFSHLTQMCEICHTNCSLFEIKIINNEQPVCKSCYILIQKAMLCPDYRVAREYPEKYKIYMNNDMYSVRGKYVLNKWGLVIGDVIQKKIRLRVFMDIPCFLCKGPVTINNECYINGYLYHYECSKLC